MGTHYTGSEEEVLALDAFIKLTRATDSLLSRLSQSESLKQLTVSQFGVLEMLYHLGPLSLGEISEKLLKSTGNITVVIDNLEKQNLVVRVREQQDRRIIRVSLTPEGRERIKKLFPYHVRAIREQMKVLNKDEQRMLAELCKRLGRQEYISKSNGEKNGKN